MRAYFFGNFYLSSIQQGIQAGHVIGEMSIQAEHELESQYRDWAINHKTMILLNGGMASNLHDIVALFDRNDNPYCHECFREEEAALEGSITSVGIIIPEKIYQGASDWRNGLIDPQELTEVVAIPGARGLMTQMVFTRFDFELMTLMNSCRLAS
jgi:hypothetical protein